MNPENSSSPDVGVAGDDVVRALLNVVIHPVWREAVAVVRDANALRVRDQELEARRVKAYEDRTKVLEQALPKVVPIALSFLGVLVGYLALQLGVTPPGYPGP